ncbi:hypothetical protein AB0M20_33680 [Actinoplanes sp. NPDC051633]|uniref:hypothetical protein n=1 Tax=Actinoplanes sp. NPDC051633 TaxID=3155670 RepID=UPI003414ADB3
MFIAVAATLALMGGAVGLTLDRPPDASPARDRRCNALIGLILIALAAGLVFGAVHLF